MSFGKWRPFCLCLSVLIYRGWDKMAAIISLKCVPKGAVYNIPASVQADGKHYLNLWWPPMLMNTCVTQPWWVKIMKEMENPAEILYIYDLEENVAKIHSPDCQFYFSQAVGQWDMSSPALGLYPTLFPYTVRETKFLQHLPPNECPLYVLYKIPLAQVNFLLNQLKMHSHWQAGELKFPSLL